MKISRTSTKAVSLLVSLFLAYPASACDTISVDDFWTNRSLATIAYIDQVRDARAAKRSDPICSIQASTFSVAPRSERFFLFLHNRTGGIEAPGPGYAVLKIYRRQNTADFDKGIALHLNRYGSWETENGNNAPCTRRRQTYRGSSKTQCEFESERQVLELIDGDLDILGHRDFAKWNAKVPLTPDISMSFLSSWPSEIRKIDRTNWDLQIDLRAVNSIEKNQFGNDYFNSIPTFPITAYGSQEIIVETRVYFSGRTIDRKLVVSF